MQPCLLGLGTGAVSDSVRGQVGWNPGQPGLGADSKAAEWRASAVVALRFAPRQPSTPFCLEESSLLWARVESS